MHIQLKQFIQKMKYVFIGILCKQTKNWSSKFFISILAQQVSGEKVAGSLEQCSNKYE